MKQLSIIIPAYKQEKTIVKNLQNLDKIASRLNISYEIICVVDGMLDNTWSEAKKAKLKNVVVVGYKRNRGKGSAVRFGMSKANGSIIASVDAGDDLSPEGLDMMLAHFYWYKADIVVGSKRHSASKVTYPWQRRIMSFGYQWIVRILFGLKVRDTQVGMKIYKKQVLDALLPRLLVKQYAFDIEMLSVANYLGFSRIYEAPIELRLDFNKSSSIVSKGFLRTISKMLKDTCAVFYRLKITKYYDENNMINWHTDVYPDEI